MAIDIALRHRTAYRYHELAQLGPQVIRLRPTPHCRTRILSYSLSITPKLHFLNWQQDPQGNYLARLVFPERTREFAIDVDLVAEMAVANPFDFFLEPEAETFPFTYAPWLARELAPYLTPVPAGPLLAEWLASVPREETRTTDFLVTLNERLQREIAHPHGGRRPDLRGDACLAEAFLPRHRLAACRSCAISASPPASSPVT